MKLILFYSEGPPHDNGLNLSVEKNLMIKRYKNDFDEIIAYTPSILKNLGYEDLCNEYDDHGLIIGNKEQKAIGFSKWKPLICRLELLKSSAEDIIVYHDVNCKKYPMYLKFIDVKNTIIILLNKCKFDFFFPQEHGNPLKLWCKKNVLEELGENNEFNYNFSQLCVNFIILKNTQITMDMLNEWESACKIERFINGKSYVTETDVRAHCPEQAILNNIIANWIRTKKHNIDKKYPFVYLKRRQINCFRNITDYRYLKYLKPISTK